MSLFGGLFSGGGAGKSSLLFSEGNKFKVHEDDKAATTSEHDVEDTIKTKKRKQAAGDSQPEQAAEPAAKTAEDAANTARALAGAKSKKHKVDSVLTQKQQQQEQQQQQQAKQQHKPSKQATADTVVPAAAAAPAQTAANNTDKQQKTRQQQQQQPSKKSKNVKHIETPAAATGSSASESDDDTSAESDGAAADIKQEQQQQQHPKEKEDPVVAAEKLARTVFVGNLPVTIKRKAVARLFAQYGAVDSVRLRSVPLDLESKKKLPRKAAVIKGVVSEDRGGTNSYVVFKEAAAATAALAANMTEVSGHHIRVDRAAPPAAAGGGAAGVMYEPARSVFVGNLDFKVTEEDLIKTFSSGEVQAELAGAVEAVRVVRDSKTNIGKGIAYVLFKTKAAARAALQLDGNKLRERAMRVSRVDRKASARDRAAAKPGGKFGGRQDGKMGGKFAGKGGKFAGERAGGRGGPAGALGVRQGGVQKKTAAAADWQGLRTKGKGSGFRAAKGSKAEAAGKKSSRGNNKDGKGRPTGATKGKGAVKSKRPAVAARKAKVKAAAAKANKGGAGK